TPCELSPRRESACRSMLSVGSRLHDVSLIRSLVEEVPMKERSRMPIALLTLVLLAGPGAAALLAADTPSEDGKALYSKKCAMCHGPEGVAKPTAKGS